MILKQWNGFFLFCLFVCLFLKDLSSVSSSLCKTASVTSPQKGVFFTLYIPELVYHKIQDINNKSLQ